jgi:hypothetical protein
MSWITLYVSGRTGIELQLNRFMTKSGSDFLSGTVNEQGLLLYWVKQDFQLHKMKVAIGSKLLFRFRMRFFFSADTFTTARSKNKRLPYFTEDQEQMFREMN